MSDQRTPYDSGDIGDREKTALLLRLLIHSGVFIALFLIIYLSSDRSREKFSESLVEALILSSIAFVAHSLETSDKKFDQRLGSIRDLINRTHEMSQSMHQSFTTFQRNIEQDVDTMSHIRDVVAELSQAALIGQRLSSALGDEEGANIAIAATRSFTTYSKAWLSLSEKMSRTTDPMHRYAWVSLVETYLSNHGSQVQRGLLQTSPSVYTQIVIGCCQRLMERIAASQELTLYLVTGMLPNQFFNWPQVATSTGDSRIRYIARAWTGSDTYFAQMKVLCNSVRVTRCILVRDSNSERRFPALRTFSELDALRDKYIFNTPISVSQFKTLELEDVFPEVAEMSFEETAEIVNVEEFRFYPISNTTGFEKSLISPDAKLLHIFRSELHSKGNENCRYYVMHSSEGVLDVFFPTKETVPEAAFFGIRDKAGEQTPSWVCGIVAYLKPFTENIEINFIVGSDGEKFLRALVDLQTRSTIMPP
jgi:hypothetical protein